MIKVFENNPRKFMSEAAMLSSVTEGEDYENLLRVFSNAITQGTGDENDLDPKILMEFAYVIRQGKDNLPIGNALLGSSLKGLQKRLKTAQNSAAPKTQYELIRTASSVLDAMVDIGVSGISRTDLSEPLLGQLKSLSQHQELRLAQAAGYAYQALLGVPNDETTGQAVWRRFLTVANLVMTTTGAVTTMDPGALFGAVQQSLTDVPDLINELIDAVKSRSGKHWYVALRCTDIFLQMGCFEELERYITGTARRQDKEFLCGLYAQLETHVLTSDNESKKKQALSLLDKLLAQHQSTPGRVQAWGRLVAQTLERPVPPEAPQRGFFGLARAREYASTLRGFPKGNMEPETHASSLLEQSWNDCEEAQFYYAAIALREHYCGANLLEIQRISGDVLPMGQCYINLAIVEGTTQANSKQESSPFSMLARLKVDTVDDRRQISLATLFHPRKQSDGTSVTPKRILIRGQAGVGKTTLCKKIVHDYLRKNMWQESFDWVFWVPLRRLKEKSSTYNLQQLIHDEYFAHHPDGEIFAQALRKSIDGRSHNRRTLFILDGLDEVSQEWESQAPMDKYLRHLLHQPQVIVTSRPYRINFDRLGPIDLDLETVGFQPRQVEAYVNTREIVHDQDMAKEIQSFIQDHMLIQGLVRIPIQLDALCYSWNQDLLQKGALKTMTTIYLAIMRRLWQKDILRLEKQDQGKPLMEHDVHTFRNWSQIQDIVPAEINLLEGLAFTGLYNEVIEFNSEDRNQIYQHMKDQGINLPRLYESSFRKLSFLRTSDDTLKDHERTYHFLHLTFQEFFAAQYFVRHWVENRAFSCLRLRSKKRDDSSITPQQFLQKEKYNTRYDILWRFVAGLLQDYWSQNDRTEEPLIRYFHELEAEPHDLLGPAHQRILMHCFNEIEHPRRAEMERRLSQWLLFECNFSQDCQLGREMECPERLLNDLLREESDQVKIKTLQALTLRRSISPGILSQAACWLNSDVPIDLKMAALHMLPYHLKASPGEALDALVSSLKDGKSNVRGSAAEALGRQSALPKEILDALVSSLKDDDSDVRGNAAYALGRQSALPKEILDALVSSLKDDNSYVRWRAAYALGRQSTLPKEILDALVSSLKDDDSDVRGNAADALGRQSALPKEILDALVSSLKDDDSVVRGSAADALGGQSALPKEVLDALVSSLKDDDSDVRWRAADTLGGQSTLPREIVDSLMSLLSDSNLMRHDLPDPPPLAFEL